LAALGCFWPEFGHSESEVINSDIASTSVASYNRDNTNREA